MAHTENRWGFWVPISDEDSARYAVRMVGLPVVLMAFNAGVFALFVALLGGYLIASGYAVIALVFAVLAFRIRAGHQAFVPVFVVLYIGFVLSAVLWTPSVTLIVSILAGLLCVSGLRGWWWLRRHGHS